MLEKYVTGYQCCLGDVGLLWLLPELNGPWAHFGVTFLMV